MPCLTMGVVNARGEKVLVAEGRDEVTMSYRSPFEEGDSVFFECDEPGTLLMVRACDYAEPVVALYAGGTYTFPIPFGEAVRPYGNIAFLGSRHWGYARTLSARERQNYRNLAENPFDFPGNKVLYPHAETNVTTTEQYFARHRRRLRDLKARKLASRLLGHQPAGRRLAPARVWANGLVRPGGSLSSRRVSARQLVEERDARHLARRFVDTQSREVWPRASLRPGVA